jgi:hypothetical protein
MKASIKILSKGVMLGTSIIFSAIRREDAFSHRV